MSVQSANYCKPFPTDLILEATSFLPIKEKRSCCMASKELKARVTVQIQRETHEQLVVLVKKIQSRVDDFKIYPQAADLNNNSSLREMVCQLAREKEQSHNSIDTFAKIIEQIFEIKGPLKMWKEWHPDADIKQKIPAVEEIESKIKEMNHSLLNGALQELETIIYKSL
ncbi:MAG: hypothetical protein WB791_08895 [Waddliaceae bacterium]